MQVSQQLLAFEQHRQPFGALVVQNAFFVFQVPLQPRDLRLLDGFGALVFLLPLARENLAVHYRALDAWRAVERSVFHIARFLAENRAQQLLFRRELRLAFGRDLAHQNVARLDGGADANHAAFVEITQERIGDVRDVASDFLGT